MFSRATLLLLPAAVDAVLNPMGDGQMIFYPITDQRGHEFLQDDEGLGEISASLSESKSGDQGMIKLISDSITVENGLLLPELLQPGSEGRGSVPPFGCFCDGARSGCETAGSVDRVLRDKEGGSAKAVEDDATTGEARKDFNSPAWCAKRCAGFRFFGVETGDQCWCGNVFSNAEQANDDECNTACSGDETQTCGAFDRIEIYDMVEFEFVEGDPKASRAVHTAVKNNPKEVLHSVEKASVRCCDLAAGTCTSKVGNTTTCLPGENNFAKAGPLSYDDAVAECAEYGMTLCTQDLLQKKQEPGTIGVGGCGESGCQYNDKWVWKLDGQFEHHRQEVTHAAEARMFLQQETTHTAAGPVSMPL